MRYMDLGFTKLKIVAKPYAPLLPKSNSLSYFTLDHVSSVRRGRLSKVFSSFRKKTHKNTKSSRDATQCILILGDKNVAKCCNAIRSK